MTPRSAASRGPGTSDAEHFGREEDRWHQDADRAKREAADTPLDALVDALYEDRCLPPPQTDHALHVIAALRRRGFVIGAATATVPLDADAWQAGYEACWNRLKDAGRLLPSDGATAAVPLDVERLARALRSLIEGPDWKGRPDPYAKGMVP